MAELLLSTSTEATPYIHNDILQREWRVIVCPIVNGQCPADISGKFASVIAWEMQCFIKSFAYRAEAYWL